MAGRKLDRGSNCNGYTVTGEPEGIGGYWKQLVGEASVEIGLGDG